MQVLILAGGLGTRLRPIVVDRPKPMAEVANQPFLAYQIVQLRDQGFHEFVLCVGYQADQIEGHFQDGSQWGVSISYAVETELLGTAGAIRNARPLVHGPFLAMNGDSFVETSAAALVSHHQEKRAADPQVMGTLLTVHVDDASGYGTLERDAEGRVVRFREKASAQNGWINGGIYVLEPEVLDLIPAGRAVSIERETFPLLLARGWRLYTFATAGFFVDIGTAEGYARFRQYVAQSGLQGEPT